MMGFFMMLIVFGAIASLACLIDERAARRAPAPFAVFFIGLGVYVMVFVLGFLGSLVSPALGDTLAFVVGPIVGSVGGGVLGYCLGRKRARHYSRKEL